MVYANRGDQSRAGFKAKPVVVPRHVPTTAITIPTINGFNPCVKLPRFNKMKINAKVAITSEKKLKIGLFIAGRVAKITTLFNSS